MLLSIPSVNVDFSIMRLVARCRIAKIIPNTAGIISLILNNSSFVSPINMLNNKIAPTKIAAPEKPTLFKKSIFSTSKIPARLRPQRVNPKAKEKYIWLILSLGL